MGITIEDNFLQNVNENLGVAHKILRIYFQDVHEREDVLQEMMFQLWRSYPHFDNRSKFSTWMYRVCLNTVLTMKKSIKKNKNVLISSSHESIALDDPIDNREDFRLLNEAINNLSPLNKAIVLLYLENMTYEEIASIIGLTRTNVSVRLVRIKKELRTFFKQKI